MITILESITEVFSQPFFIIFSGITVTITAFWLLYNFILTLNGLLPVLHRLGFGLSRRKIALFSADEKYRELRNILVHSNIFKRKNIHKIEKSEVDRVSSYNLVLVHYESQKDILTNILDKKKDECALIVYAPPDEGRVDNVVMDKINSKRNAIVVNFKGRLLNDVLVSMMTTGYVIKHN